MSVTPQFVDLGQDRAELIALLRDANLIEPGEDPPVHPLDGGVSSTIFHVCLRRGDVCVKQALPKLKVAKDWHAPTERVFAEMAWLNTVAEILPENVPHVIAHDTNRRAIVMTYLAPSLYPNWKSELIAGRFHAEIGGQMGEILGTIHARTAHNADVARRFDNDANFFALRLEPYLVEAARQHPEVEPRLLEIVHSVQTHKMALIHGDVSPKNILIGVHRPVMLDAECACYGDPAFDLAFLLNHLLLKAVRDYANAAAFAGLFENVVAHYLRHVSWESAEFFEKRVAALLPGLLLARIDGKSPVEYLLPGQRIELRKVAKQLLSATPQRLTDELALVLSRMCRTPARNASPILNSSA